MGGLGLEFWRGLLEAVKVDGARSLKVFKGVETWVGDLR